MIVSTSRETLERPLREKADGGLRPLLKITAKRNVFVSIQNGHTISAEGYRQPYVQTGFETLASQRVDDLFCFTAKEKGKVIVLTEKAIQVEYITGERKGVFLGRQYGDAEGSTYPHDIISFLKEGDKFEKGDVIAYNSGFWERDFLDSRKVVMKFSLMTTVAFEEDARTHEDSCSISKDLSTKLNASTTKVSKYVVQFTQNLHDVLKPGTVVEPDSILMSIEDEITSGTNMFDSDSAALLGKLSRMNPKAGYSGTIDKIEVFYHGEKTDMSPALKALADKSDKFLVDQAKEAGTPVFNGRVTSEYRVAGKNLQLDSAEIKFYITVKNGMSTGDKAVFSNQLKSTVCEVMEYSMRTESGIKVDARFGGRSAIKRLVNSYGVVGTTTALLQEAAKKMVDMYEA